MKRREFIIKSILTGVGLSFTPTLLFADNKFDTLKIGPVNVHQRHGNLFASKHHMVNHNGLTSICRDVFYQNGLEPSDNDAYHLKLTINNKESSVFYTHKTDSSSPIKVYQKEYVDLKKGDILIPLKNGEQALVSKVECLKHWIDQPTAVI